MDSSQRGGEDRSEGDPEFNNRAAPEDQFIDDIRLNQAEPREPQGSTEVQEHPQPQLGLNLNLRPQGFTLVLPENGQEGQALQNLGLDTDRTFDQSHMDVETARGPGTIDEAEPSLEYKHEGLNQVMRGEPILETDMKEDQTQGRLKVEINHRRKINFIKHNRDTIKAKSKMLSPVVKLKNQAVPKHLMIDQGKLKEAHQIDFFRRPDGGQKRKNHERVSQSIDAWSLSNYPISRLQMSETVKSDQSNKVFFQQAGVAPNNRTKRNLSKSPRDAAASDHSSSKFHKHLMKTTNQFQFNKDIDHQLQQFKAASPQKNTSFYNTTKRMVAVQEGNDLSPNPKMKILEQKVLPPLKIKAKKLPSIRFNDEAALSNSSSLQVSPDRFMRPQAQESLQKSQSFKKKQEGFVDSYYDSHFVNTHTARQNSLEQMLSPLPEGPQEAEKQKIKIAKRKKCSKAPKRVTLVNRSKESLDQLDSSQRIYQIYNVSNLSNAHQISDKYKVESKERSLKRVPKPQKETTLVNLSSNVLNQSVNLEKPLDSGKPRGPQQRRAQRFIDESLNGMRQVFDSDTPSPIHPGASSMEQGSSNFPGASPHVIENSSVMFPQQYLIEDQQVDPIGNGIASNPLTHPDSSPNSAQHLNERARLNSRGQGARRKSRGNAIGGNRPRKDLHQGGGLEGVDPIDQMRYMGQSRPDPVIDMDKGFEDQFNLPENLKNNISSDIKIVSFGQPIDHLFGKPSNAPQQPPQFQPKPRGSSSGGMRMPHSNLIEPTPQKYTFKEDRPQTRGNQSHVSGGNWTAQGGMRQRMSRKAPRLIQDEVSLTGGSQQFANPYQVPYQAPSQERFPQQPPNANSSILNQLRDQQEIRAEIASKKDTMSSLKISSRMPVQSLSRAGEGQPGFPGYIQIEQDDPKVLSPNQVKFFGRHQHSLEKPDFESIEGSLLQSRPVKKTGSLVKQAKARLEAASLMGAAGEGKRAGNKKVQPYLEQVKLKMQAKPK